MASTSIFRATMVAAVLLLSGVEAQHRDFLRKVNTQEIVNDIETSLSAILSGHSSPAASKRLAKIEASLWQAFQSLPKNSMGRLDAPGVRHIVHGFFAREHGWQIKGLEPEGLLANVTSTKVHDASILQDKAPALVEGLLMARHQDSGLALTDIVAMVSVLEQLVFDESVALLEAAYRLNSKSVAESLDEPSLHNVLKSYLVLFGQGSKADLFDAAKHQAILAARPREDIDDFEGNAVLNFEYARRHERNPFVPREYTFEVVADIVADLAQRYGKWQNAECQDMKNHLVELDPDNTGRVPLGLLYAQPATASYHFSESAEYLRKIGALDESTSTPKVLIANYITGPSNCIASSSYYSVCCLSNCDSIISDIEHKVLAPTASPERLLGIVRNISRGYTLSKALTDKLDEIASQHGGEVPIHGRLFAQWLHFASPHECPFPTLVESSDVFAASNWHRTEYSATSEERTNHVLSVETSALDANDVDVDQLWSDYEVLPTFVEPKSTSSTLMTVVRGTAQLAAVFVGLRSMYAAWSSATGETDSKGKFSYKKNDDFVTSLSV